VANEDAAIALPQPNVLNFASVMILSLTSICNLITSPHSGAPTKPVPTLDFDLSNVPTFLGLLKWSITLFPYDIILFFLKFTPNPKVPLRKLKIGFYGYCFIFINIKYEE
jgi:hypothetical protein